MKRKKFEYKCVSNKNLKGYKVKTYEPIMVKEERTEEIRRCTNKAFRGQEDYSNGEKKSKGSQRTGYKRYA